MARTGIDNDRSKDPLTTRPVGDLTSFDGWLASLDRSKVWGWRLRKEELIPTVNLMGRVFVSRTAIAEFERRALAGEFAKTHCPPRQKTPNAPDNNESTTLS